MPPSAARSAANRANARRSTGPRTAAGMAASSSNALSHGLTAGRALLPGEDPGELEALAAGIAAALRPRDALEAVLVDDVVAAAWRLRRVPRVEAGILALGSSSPAARALSGADAGAALALAVAWTDGAHALSLLSRYEASLASRARRSLLDLERRRGAGRAR